MDTQRFSRRQRLTRRGLLWGGGLALGGAVLSACGQVAPAAPAAPGKPEAPQGEPKAAAAPKAGPVALSVWVWWPQPVPAVQEMGKGFTSNNPQVTVNAEAVGGYWGKLEPAIIGGAGPDIFLMNNVNYYAWSYRQLPADISAPFKADANARDFQEHAWQPALDFYNYHGAFYGLPYMMTSIITLYNEEAIKEAGLASPADLGEE